MSKESTPALDEVIDELFDTRAEIRTVNKQLDTLKGRKEELETVLLEMLDAVGLDQARSAVATATVSETVVPQVTDWDKYYNYIHRNKAYYLLERRPAAVAFRETLESRKGKPIPGVSSFTKRTVGLRTRATK